MIGLVSYTSLTRLSSIKIFKNRTVDDLIHDDYCAHAMGSVIVVIGEAKKNIPAPIKRQHLDIPWRDLVELRDMIIKRDFRITYSLVWNR